MLTSACLISSVCVRGGGVEGGGEMELWVGNVRRLFSLLYIAASHTVHIPNISRVLLVIGCFIL